MTERIPLSYPIEHDGLPIAEIALRRPTVGDHLAAQKIASTDAEREARLITHDPRQAAFAAGWMNRMAEFVEGAA